MIDLFPPYWLIRLPVAAVWLAPQAFVQTTVGTF